MHVGVRSTRYASGQARTHARWLVVARTPRKAGRPASHVKLKLKTSNLPAVNLNEHVPPKSGHGRHTGEAKRICLRALRRRSRCV
jgi:hypothetical protein